MARRRGGGFDRFDTFDVFDRSARPEKSGWFNTLASFDTFDTFDSVSGFRDVGGFSGARVVHGPVAADGDVLAERFDVFDTVFANGVVLAEGDVAGFDDCHALFDIVDGARGVSALSAQSASFLCVRVLGGSCS